MSATAQARGREGERVSTRDGRRAQNTGRLWSQKFKGTESKATSFGRRRADSTKF